MTDQTELKATGDHPAKAAEAALEKRRRLLKLGVSATPIVLTLVSRPVLAWHCKPPSAYASANLSGRTQVSTPDGGTRTIASWATNPQQTTNPNYNWWPSPYNAQTTLMSAVFFGTTGLMLDHLKTGLPLEKYLIAALLNTKISGGASTCLSLKDIMEMYKYGPLGTYQPPDSPGINWNSADIITYLQQNWIVTG
jgi:hypothetical protein